MAINRSGISDHASIARTLAKLVSHRVSLDLSPLHGQLQATYPQKSLVKTITLGGRRIGSTILTQENIDSLSAPVLRTPSRNREPERIDLPIEREIEITQDRLLPCPPVMDPPRADEFHGLVGPQRTPDLSALHQKLNEHMALVSKSHDSFLQARSVALRQAGELIQLQIAAAQQILNHSVQSQEGTFVDRAPAQAAAISSVKSASLPIHSPAHPVPESKIRNSEVVWAQADLVEFAQERLRLSLGMNTPSSTPTADACGFRPTLISWSAGSPKSRGKEESTSLPLLRPSMIFPTTPGIQSIGRFPGRWPSSQVNVTFC